MVKIITASLQDLGSIGHSEEDDDDFEELSIIDSKNNETMLALALAGPTAVIQDDSGTAPSSWSHMACRGGMLASASVKCGCLQ